MFKRRSRGGRRKSRGRSSKKRQIVTVARGGIRM